MSSLFSKALAYLGLVDEDQLDAESGEPLRQVSLDENNRSGIDPVTLGRRVEPPSTSRAAARPSGRSEGAEGIRLVHPVEVRSDILLIEEVGDSRILADRVRERTPVVLDLRQADQGLVRRVVDFSSGLIYALDGSMRKVGDGLVLVLPPRVMLSRDEKRRLASLGAYELDDIDD